jgi:hypothetical protein
MARSLSTAGPDFLSWTADQPLTGYPLTVAGWFNTTNAGALQRPISMQDAGASKLVGFLVGYPGAGQFTTQIAMSTGNVLPTSSGTVTANTWQHGAHVSASSSNHTVYLDGGNSTNDTTLRGFESGMDRIYLGTANAGAIHNFGGLLAEFGIWDAALDADEIAALAKGLSPLMVRPESLLFYAPLQSRASPEIELIGRRELTLTGTTVADHPRIYTPAGPPFASSVPAVGGGPPATAARRLPLLGAG